MKTRAIRTVLNGLCEELDKAKQDKTITYEVRESDDTIMVVKHWMGDFDGYVAKVSKTDSDYSFSITDDENLNDSALQPFIKAIQDYSMTSIEDRKDEKRWYIHLGINDISYLNQDKETGTYALNNESETDSYRTKFTRSEIEDWAGTSNDDVIGWIIGKFGEGV